MSDPTITPDPVDLLFGGMAKLGPGDDADTSRMLRLLPTRRFRLVVDAGCGTGRQTLVLARELRTVVHAVDSHASFLDDLLRRARDARLDHLVHVLCRDMNDIPRIFQGIDLLWSEGAAYNIGFREALNVWRPALTASGFLVVSELSWLTEQAPDEARRFFATGYPDMRSVRDNVGAAEDAGYQVLATDTLPRHAWEDGYYEVLARRAKDLLDHADSSVREFAADTIREIDVFHRSEDSYGYVFYVLQRARE